MVGMENAWPKVTTTSPGHDFWGSPAVDTPGPLGNVSGKPQSTRITVRSSWGELDAGPEAHLSA